MPASKRKRDGQSSSYSTGTSKRPKYSARKTGAAGSTTGIPSRGRGYLRTGGVYGRFQPRGPELKYFDTGLDFNIPYGNISVSTGNSNGIICLVPQGAGANQRIGRKIQLKSVQLDLFMTRKAKVLFNVGDTISPMVTNLENYLNGVPQILQVWVILDKQFNGTPATAGEIFETPLINNAARKLENSERFQVLAKIEETVPPTPYAASLVEQTSESKTLFMMQPYHSHKTFYRKLNIPIEFNGAIGDIAEIRSNSIYLAFGSYSPDFSGTVDSLFKVTGYARIRYSDQ